jgi:Glycosyl hydrolase family 76
LAGRSRSARLLGSLISALCVGLAVLAAHATASPNDGQAEQRALMTYQAMQKYFFVPKDDGYSGTYPARDHAQAWPYSQALRATIELARLPGEEGFRHAVLARVAGLSHYLHPQPGRPIAYAPVYGGQGNVFYDDNLWIALALVRATDVVNSAAFVTTAHEIFQLVSDGWDRNTTDPCQGGIFWKRAGSNHDRNTVTTANFALLAMLLYERSHTQSYLTWAKASYDWVQRCLSLPDGLIADHITLDGTVDRSVWSYNQGAMIDVGARLYRATKSTRYLRDAERTATASLHLVGAALASRDPPIFLAIFYRDLLTLAETDKRGDLRAALKTFADRAWTSARDPTTGLFRFGNGSTLLDQAAMVQVYAALAATA